MVHELKRSSHHYHVEEADRIARRIERERAPWPADLYRLAAARITSLAEPTEREKASFRRDALLYT